MNHSDRTRIFLRFLFLILILEPIWASTWFTRRDMLWDDSPWLEDPVGVGGGGLGEIWNQLTGTEAPPTIPPSTEPPENSPVEEGSQPATPNAMEPLLEPSGMKKCSAVKGEAPGDQADQGSADASLDRVEQDPITGRPMMEDCPAPNNNPDDAYLVQEIRFIEGRLREGNWPAAILVTDLTTEIDIRYDVTRQGQKYLIRKVANFKFLRQGQVIKLGYVGRRGWLIGAGMPKEEALKWFEGYLDRVGYAAPPTTSYEPSHYTAIWARRVFWRLWSEPTRPPHWVPIENNY